MESTSFSDCRSCTTPSRAPVFFVGVAPFLRLGERFRLRHKGFLMEYGSECDGRGSLDPVVGAHGADEEVFLQRSRGAVVEMQIQQGEENDGAHRRATPHFLTRASARGASGRVSARAS